jgi:hypothetical protein
MAGAGGTFAARTAGQGTTIWTSTTQYKGQDSIAAIRFELGGQLQMRTRPCVRLFCIVDTLTSASVLPGINYIIDEAPASVVCSGHDHIDNMSSQVLASFAIPMIGAVHMGKSCTNSHFPGFGFGWGAANLSKLNSKKLSCRPLDEVAREAGKLIRSPTA